MKRFATYPQRLAWAMRCAGLNPGAGGQSELARLTSEVTGEKCSPQTVQYLLDRGKSSKFTPGFAVVLQCGVNWLANNVGEPPTEGGTLAPTATIESPRADSASPRERMIAAMRELFFSGKQMAQVLELIEENEQRLRDVKANYKKLGFADPVPDARVREHIKPAPKTKREKPKEAEK